MESNSGPVLDAWMYYIDVADKHVFIVTYGCYPQNTGDPVLSHEHKEVDLFTEQEIPDLNMPGVHRNSIATWFRSCRSDSESFL